MKLYLNLSIFLLRVSMGWLFFYAGYEKLISNFTAYGYLSHLSGQFAGFFSPLAGNPLVDQLVVWGELLIGICLLFGVLVRFASFWGIVMMFLFYFSGYPFEHAFLVNEHIIYVLVLFFLIFSESGKIWGFGKILDKKFPKLKTFMG